ncbi:MAG: hypothetical protein INF69_14630, partial [Roseomonas sp.]|nr:hypothetical protein [Roseomonas sp.]
MNLGANSSSGALGNDRLISIENVLGGNGDDSITGNGSDNWLYGGLGNDTLVAGAFHAWGDWASYVFSIGAVTVDLLAGTSSGADGNDSLVGFENLHGGSGDNWLVGSTDGRRIIGGGLGNDTIVGVDARALFMLATGAVTVDLAAGTTSGADAQDSLFGISGIEADSGFDDSILGSMRDERFNLGIGNDTLVGGGGRDAIHFALLASGVTVDLAAGYARSGFGTDSLVGISDIWATTSADSLLGNADNNWINGWQASDTIEGREGDDTLLADFEAESYLPGAADLLSYAGAGGGVTVNMLAGTASGAAGNDSFNGFEVVQGGSFADNLVGSDRIDTLNGGAGDDTLAAGLGNDSVLGGAGNDWASYADATGSVTVTLSSTNSTSATGALGNDVLWQIEAVQGGNFNDSLLAGGGNNSLQGGLGNDTLDGGADGDWASYAGAGGAVTVDLGAGSSAGADGIDSLTRIEGVVGGIGADSLMGDSLDNSLDGGAGNDTLLGGEGNDWAGFGSASAGVTVDLGAASSSGAAGIDSLIGIENLQGSGFADSLLGDSLSNALDGGAGNDTLDGGFGNDTVEGGLGNDSVFDGGGTSDWLQFVGGAALATTVDLGAGTVSGRFGQDTISGFENVTNSGGGDFRAFGDARDNFLRSSGPNGGSGPNGWMWGRDGNDTLVSGSWASHLTGGTGDDSISGGYQFSVVYYNDVSGSVTVDLTTLRAIGAAGNDSLASVDHIISGNGSDSLVGDAGFNFFNALDGADTVAGLDGNDDLRGYGGDDSLDGGNGIDVASYHVGVTAGVTVDLGLGRAWGGGDNDSLTGIENVAGSGFNDSILGDSGANLLDGGIGLDNLPGSGADTLAGGLGNDTLQGGADNDSLAGGDGDDSLIGGTGIDWASYAGVNGAVTVDLAAGLATGADGNDTLSSIENVLGGNANDSLNGDGGANVLDGGLGNDTLVGGAGQDTISYASMAQGSQAVTVDLGAGTSSGAAGNDSFTGFEGIQGGNGADSLLGDSLDNIIAGGFGNDTLDGGLGNDTISYGELTDSLLGVTVDLGAGTSSGGAGNDSFTGFEAILGGAGNDSLVGDAGANFLIGGLRNDTLAGGNGNDTLIGSLGVDWIFSGNGDDSIADNPSIPFTTDTNWLSFAFAGGMVTVDLVAGRAWGEGNDTVSGIQNLQGGNFADSLLGNGLANSLYGGLGDDTLIGGGSNDLLNGGLGNDTLVGGTESGDWASFASAGGMVTVDLVAGRAWGEGNDNLSGLENVQGGNSADSVLGDGNANVIAGGFANDTLDGGLGNDTVSYEDMTLGVTVDLGAGTSAGAAGIDSFTGFEGARGGDANDSLFGDSVANILGGGAGNDTLSGGAGADTLIGNADNDWVDYSAANGAVTVDLGAGTSSGAADNDSLLGIEVVQGGNGNDQLAGSNSVVSDTLIGGAGNDTLLGGVGWDSLAGGEGTDLISFARLTGAVTVDLSAGIANVRRDIDLLPGEASLVYDGRLNVLSASSYSWQDARNFFVARGGNLAAINDLSENNQLFSLASGRGLTNGYFGLSDTEQEGLWRWSNGEAFSFSNWYPGEPTNSNDIEHFTSFFIGTPLWNDYDASFSLRAFGEFIIASSSTLSGIENAFGSAGDDFLLGNDLANLLGGGAGNDSLAGGNGADTLNGGLGNDTLVGGNGADSLLGSVADETLNGGLGNDSLSGGAGNDWASYAGASAGVTVDLGAGSSAGAAGVDSLTEIEALLGGDGNDKLIGSNSADKLNGGNGNDDLAGGNGDDSLFGDEGNDTLDGGTGNDSFLGGDGSDSIFGGDGTGDLVDYSHVTGGLTIDLATGIIISGAGNDTLSGVEIINGSNNNDWMQGGVGDDTLSSDAGQNTLLGFDGNDSLTGGIHNDMLDGGNHNDTLVGNDGHDSLLGQDGNDSLLGGADNDTLLGGNLHDTLNGGSGDDSLDGGIGNDLLSYDGATNGVMANLSLGRAKASADTITGFESLAGSSNNDTLVGDNNANGVLGGAGNDSLSGL